MSTPQKDLKSLMTTHAPSLLRYAERLVRDPHTAQDVVQHAFIKYAGLEDNRRPGVSSVRSWLYRVVHNRAVDHIRSDQRRKELHETHAEVEESRRDSSSRHQKQAVLESLHLLNEKEKTVLLLRLEEGLSYQEIEDITGIKQGHVGYLLHHAIRTLSTHLNPGAEA